MEEILFCLSTAGVSVSRDRRTMRSIKMPAVKGVRRGWGGIAPGGGGRGLFSGRGRWKRWPRPVGKSSFGSSLL